MLANLNDVLPKARENGYGVGLFNTINLEGFTPKGTKNDRWVKADTGQAGKRESKRLPLSCFFSLGQKFCSQNG